MSPEFEKFLMMVIIGFGVGYVVVGPIAVGVIYWFSRRKKK